MTLLTKHDNIFNLYLNLNNKTRCQVKTILAKEFKIVEKKIDLWITTKNTPLKHQEQIINILQNITIIKTI